MLRIISFFAVLLMAALPNAVEAQLAGEWRFCTGTPDVDWDLQIKNCSPWAWLAIGKPALSNRIAG